MGVGAGPPWCPHRAAHGYLAWRPPGPQQRQPWPRGPLEACSPGKAESHPQTAAGPLQGPQLVLVPLVSRAVPTGLLPVPWEPDSVPGPRHTVGQAPVEGPQGHVCLRWVSVSGLTTREAD